MHSGEANGQTDELSAENKENKQRMVVAVASRQPGRVSLYRSDVVSVKKGDAVIIETRFGLQLGRVVGEPRMITEGKGEQSSYCIVALATPEDEKRYQELQERARKDAEFIQRKVEEHRLPMRLAETDYTFDESLYIVYFSASGRVDFRGLVQDLKQSFPVPVRLQQIGPRDHMSLVGGLGACGRKVCCAQFLTKCPTVSVKMAKQQGLALDPYPLTGLCGKLRCCLRFEQDVYQEVARCMPPLGSLVATPDGVGQVVQVNVLKEEVLVELQDGRQRTYPAKQVKCESSGYDGEV